jgi:hypothetical protein
MKTLRPLLLATLLLSVARVAVAQPEPPGDTLIPNRWFDRGKDFNQVLEIQKQTGADIFIYFERLVPDDQKGLCKWFESKGLKTGPMNRLLRDYIKMKISLPAKGEDEALAQKFDIKACPTVVILRPDGGKSFCKPFDWPNNKPELKDPEKLVELFRASSSERYQNTGGK